MSKSPHNSSEIHDAPDDNGAHHHTPDSGSSVGGKMPPRVVTIHDAPADKIAPNSVAAANAPQPKKRGGVWKALGALLLVAGVGGALLANFTHSGRQFTKEITGTFVPGMQAMVTAKQNPDYIFQVDNSDHVNILLIGRDVNYKPVLDKQGRNVAHTIDTDAAARSDTMIVMSLDRNGKMIRMVSLPRDARVHLPPNKEDVSVAKLNAAHAYGGVPLLRQTLHDELGLTIHHYAVVKFEGFKKVIDEVGGIYVDVIGALQRDGSRGRLKYDDDWGNLHIDLQPGKQWLNGQQAHDYVRFRMDLEGDPGRIRRQQSVMRALARRLKDIPPWKLPNVVKQIREQFETDMDDTQLMSAGFFAQGLGDHAQVQPVTLYGTYYQRGSVRLNKPRNQALLQTIFGPTFNPDRFLVESPWTRRWEFGPEDTDRHGKINPDTRALLIQAGLIKPGPGDRVASASGASSGPSSSDPSPSDPSSQASMIDSGPLNYSEPEANRDHSTDGNRSSAFTDSNAQFSGTEGRRADPPLIGNEAAPRRDQETSRTTEPRRRTRSENTRRDQNTQAPSDYAAPDGSFGDNTHSDSTHSESPIPRAEESAPRGNLSVESPIPRPE